jgi:fatty-acyl-CoA synthase
LSTALSLIHGAPLESEARQGAQSIPAYLAEVTTKFGVEDAIIMHSAGGRTCWSYDKLHEQASDVAKALIARGHSKGARVGVLMANRPEYLAALFGIAMAGGVAVALSTFSTRDELTHLLNVSAVELLLFDSRVLKQDFAAMLRDSVTKARAVQLDSVTNNDPPAPGFESWADFLAGGKAVSHEQVCAIAATVNPDDTAAIFFSSGTTSLPKGIVHAHRAFCIQWWRWPRVFAMREPVRSWTGNGFFWSGNVSMTVGTAFSTGGAVILQPAFDADDALRVIEEERVTCLLGRPHQWARVQSAPRWATADLSALKYVTKGDLITEHPTVQTSWSTPNAFGTTETMTICTAFDADTSPDDYAGSVGAPLPGNSLKIVDPLTGAIVPIGERGEMCIKGPTLMRGYLDKSAADCFDPDGFYWTGDGGYVDAEGRFYWEGRLTDLIKTGGANVSPDEVDAVIAKFPGVKRTQTVGVPDDLLGERVVSCIVALEGVMIDEAGLATHLRERLASYKCPRAILVLSENEFSKTGNEKPVVADIRKAAIDRLTTYA